MPDILSQGGDREPGPWPRWVTTIALLVLIVVLIFWWLPRHQRLVPLRPHRTATSVAPTRQPASDAGARGSALPAEQGGVSGRALARGSSLRLPVTGQQPAWLWPATGHTEPIAGLPRARAGYQFTRVVGGWAVQANPGTPPRCGSCAGPRLLVYFLANGGQYATPLAAANQVAPAATARSLWLTSYPAGADMSRATGTAQEVSVVGARPGPPLRLPAGYRIYRGTNSGLLLAPVAPSDKAGDRLWSPVAGQASRAFSGVIAAGAGKIAWARPCTPVCRVYALDVATGRHTVVRLPGASSVVNAAFSPDGRFLALQLSSDNRGDNGALAMQLDVVSMASGRTAVVPGTQVSSDALVSFGWPAGSDNLVAEFSFMTKVQIASWRPGARQVSVAVINPGRETTSLIDG
ncbi:MAG TPA: hypothetical protein VG253_20575 [Streptosporangiaceae bacterium]|nr:hypothetical protein [Streptosporangiaceae bacterium]